MTPSEIKAWLDRRGGETGVWDYARRRGVSVWAAANELAWFVERGYLSEERRGAAHQGVYFGSVYRVSEQYRQACGP